jgi:hypothetical protein
MGAGSISLGLSLVRVGSRHHELRWPLAGSSRHPRPINHGGKINVPPTYKSCNALEQTVMRDSDYRVVPVSHVVGSTPIGALQLFVNVVCN